MLVGMENVKKFFLSIVFWVKNILKLLYFKRPPSQERAGCIHPIHVIPCLLLNGT